MDVFSNWQAELPARKRFIAPIAYLDQPGQLVRHYPAWRPLLPSIVDIEWEKHVDELTRKENGGVLPPKPIPEYESYTVQPEPKTRKVYGALAQEAMLIPEIGCDAA